MWKKCVSVARWCAKNNKSDIFTYKNNRDYNAIINAIKIMEYEFLVIRPGIFTNKLRK
jgi:hypothetical protein